MKISQFAKKKNLIGVSKNRHVIVIVHYITDKSLQKKKKTTEN